MARAAQPRSRRRLDAGDGGGALGPWALDTVHNVDCERGLRELPADCLDVVVTSPPYWGQRGSGGLGAETDPRDYIGRLTAVLAEAMRCLKPCLLYTSDAADERSS